MTLAKTRVLINEGVTLVLTNNLWGFAYDQDNLLRKAAKPGS
jgi:hypothetical protein